MGMGMGMSKGMGKNGVVQGGKGCMGNGMNWGANASQGWGLNGKGAGGGGGGAGGGAGGKSRGEFSIKISNLPTDTNAEEVSAAYVEHGIDSFSDCYCPPGK